MNMSFGVQAATGDVGGMDASSTPSVASAAAPSAPTAFSSARFTYASPPSAVPSSAPFPAQPGFTFPAGQGPAVTVRPFPPTPMAASQAVAPPPPLQVPNPQGSHAVLPGSAATPDGTSAQAPLQLATGGVLAEAAPATSPGSLQLRPTQSRPVTPPTAALPITGLSGQIQVPPTVGGGLAAARPNLPLTSNATLPYVHRPGFTPAPVSGAAGVPPGEWENLLSEGTSQLEFLSLTKNASESPLAERNVYKQRGRGAFTHGEMGMHIDRVTTCLPKERKEANTKTEEGEQEEAFLNTQSKLTYGVRHVLVVSFSPSVTTKDLEDIFERFGSDGVAIRWVNDTTALAVFRNPETAKDALQSTRSPHFRLKLLADEDLLLDLVKEKDLQPPVPRPATSSRAAHRMILGALQRQGGRNKAPWMSNFKTSQQQEFERKQRLQTRQKLREEAWGSDDSNQ